MSESSRVIVEFFGDYVCPFSYLTQPVLYAARDQLGDSIELIWRGLELCPYPMPQLDPTSAEFTQRWHEQVETIASERGLAPLLPSVLPRSRRAMEAAAFARQAGAFDAMHKALFSAFYEQGRDISSIDELVKIGGDAGLNRLDLRKVLERGSYVLQVTADQQEAAIYGVQGVPVMVLRREDQPKSQAQALWGAQPLDGVLQGIEIVRAGE